MDRGNPMKIHKNIILFQSWYMGHFLAHFALKTGSDLRKKDTTAVS